VSAPEERLAELGIDLPQAPAPAAAYVPTVRTGNLLFVSGQVAKAGDSLVATGALGADVDVDGEIRL
jgi:enamine deaminase RidA (YjgF/YER057c/UK114 family)